MAVSTATVMRTITSITTIATTVTAPPIIDTSTLATAPVTITQSIEEEPIASSSNNSTNSSSSTTQSSASLPVSSSSDAPVSTSTSFSTSSSSTSTSASVATSSTADPASNSPVFDKQPIPTRPVTSETPSVSDTEPVSTSTSTAPTTPLFDESPVSSTSTSSVDTNTPQFILISETSSESDPVPTTTTSQSFVSEESSQVATSEPSGRSTQDSSPQTTQRSTSQSVEKAIIQPFSTSTGESAPSSSSSFSSSSSSTSSAPSTTLEAKSTSTAASSPESTQPSDSSTTRESDSGITNPQSTLTTATLPAGRVTTASLDPTAASDTSSPSESAVGAVESSSSNKPSTPVVVGSVLGSLAALSIICLLVYLFRRRLSKNRRSTLLTPLSIAPGASGSSANSEKKKHYEIDTASLGPTPLSTKLAATLAFYPKLFGKKLRLSQMPASTQSPKVNMNRGNSQFLEDPVTSHSRHSSVNGSDSSRMKGWWSRVIQDASSDDLLAQDMAERASHPVPGYVPSMDAGRLDREGQQRRMSRPHSVDSWTSRASSTNPFSDTNTTRGNSTRSYPEVLADLGNPFADSNSLLPPAAAQTAPAPVGYVQQVQRARGQSLGPRPVPRSRRESFDMVSFYRDSAATNSSSFETRRNKIHSNPFDLEIDGQEAPMRPGMQPPRRPVPSSVYDVPRPDSTRTREDSFTSRYTSGAGWPGARSTQGPVSSRWGSTVGYVPIGHVRGESDDNIVGPSGVGQAM